MKKQNIPFNEYFLHYIWKTKQIKPGILTTTEGKSLEIIQFGHYNEDAGPDFLHAVVKIDETTWVGHIEIHVLSSDWDKHNHQHDPAYKNVILHVVFFEDKKVNDIPCLALNHKIPKILIQKYHQLLKSKAWIPCAKVLHHLPESVFNLWKDSLLLEKMADKEIHIQSLLRKYTNDWEACFYVLLARYFGGKVNDSAFEMLAERTSIELIRKNIHNPMTIQALFFGQSGLLQTTCTDDYVVQLKAEYAFLVKKYQLKPMDAVCWKLSKLRPPNFPTVRIAEFSTLQNLGKSLFYSLLEAKDKKEMYLLLDNEPHVYWSDHFLFGTTSAYRQKKISDKFKDLLLMNAFLPLALVYAKTYGDENRKEWILGIYEQIQSEENKIIKRWKDAGLASRTALDSQALLYLYTSYCEKKHCLSCKIGHHIMTRKAENPVMVK
jgi:hypothetical protein